MPQEATSTSRGAIQLPELPAAAALSSATLFGFDDRAFPFTHHLQVHLRVAQQPRIVLRPGPPGSHDEVVLYYGTVIRIGQTFHMWYVGNHGPLQNTVNYERVNCCVCYATSSDGVEWVKPDLNLVEFAGSKRNNIVDLPAPNLWSTCAVLYDPDDPDPNRRFKMAYEAYFDRQIRFCVAYSPDGLRWTPSARNPVGPFLEMSGITKFRGMYYVNGQGGLRAHRPVFARRMVSFASADFEHWSPCGAVGLDRAPAVYGPATEDHAHQYEEVHLGAALCNRGNVILGIYGMWHGHPSGDRALVSMDLGLAISHDAIHFHEPIPGFRIVAAREQPERPLGVGPALMQGQGMENFGDQTLYWYSLWRGTSGNGVRLVTWPRDRLGSLSPFSPDHPMAISCPLRVLDGAARVTVNASGLGEHARIRVGVVDKGFRPINGFAVQDAEPLTGSGLELLCRWKQGDRIPAALGDFRLQVCFEGTRPEDAHLHAIVLDCA
ncbi:MAG TPA: hypothetical protein VNL70_08690 [Tepidisphaeraceae bacterium]|nr:hypothetical protein [Tepidisphaeraceae bacterium]